MLVGKTILLCLPQQLVGKRATLVRENLLFKIHQLLHLFYEPSFDVGRLDQVLDACPLAQRFVHDELPLTRRLRKHRHKIFKRLLIVVLCKTQAIAPIFS